MPYLSYSALSQWVTCPYKHKLIYKDKIKLFQGNIHTAFGKAVHETNELILKENIPLSDLDSKATYIQKKFAKFYNREVYSLPPEEKDKIFKTKEHQDLYVDMIRKGGKLSRYSIRQLHTDFPGFKVLQIEGHINEPITEFPGSNWDYAGFIDNANYDFKGILDLAIETPDGKVHIIDWKTTSWGWEAKKKTDKIQTYQLTFYKHYYSLKYDIDPKNIEIYFGLIKRTAFDKKKNPKKDIIEIFRVPCTSRKIKNALNVLNQAAYNILTDNHPKNRLNCGSCEYRRTKWCP